MNERENELNVETVMEEIRAALPAADAWKSVRFEDMPTEVCDDGGDVRRAALTPSLDGAAGSWTVKFFRPLEGSRPVRLLKKVVRKLIRFCVEPITLSVTLFQRHAAGALFALERELKKERSERERLERELLALRERLDVLESERK